MKIEMIYKGGKPVYVYIPSWYNYWFHYQLHKEEIKDTIISGIIEKAQDED